MKFTISWLKEHLDTDASLEALVEAMTMAGLEVEEVDDPASRLAPFTVAKVLHAEKHPNADKLKVCRVETKDGEKQIVCGAPNARTGLVGIYAPLGTYIPGLGQALDAKPRKIRGVESQGMLCSAREMEIGEDHSGIIDLEGDWEVGAPAAEAIGAGDAVIDFEVTPNRPDWLGVVGIARDLAACGLGAFKAPVVEAVPGRFPCPIDIQLDAPEACPTFAGRLVRGVRNGPSPEWLQQRLRAIGLRPINALVDVTNFVTYDRARPLHVYDAAKLAGPIRALMAKAGDRFLALDGKDYELTPDMCAIADDARVLGLGGVIGGEYSGCTEETREVFIEAAWFDPDRTARTGRATGVLSDAQYRFARGVDPQSCVDGIEIATTLILEMCGGEPSEVRVAGTAPEGPGPVAFDVAQVARLTGLSPSKARVVAILEALGCEVGSKRAKTLTVRPPSWRPDIGLPADLVEEVARVEGYDTLPATPLPRPEGRRAPAVTAELRRVGLARRALAARGMSEAVTWSFCRRDHAALFGGGSDDLALANPISTELEVMRPSALIHLLLASQKNADRGFDGVAAFEVGPVYRGVEADEQESVAAGVRAPSGTRHWAGVRAPDVFDVKADALAALEAAGAPIGGVQIAAPAPGWWHPGRSGVIRLGPKTVLAEFGEVHPRVLRALDVDGPALAFEVFVDRIPKARAKGGKARPALEASELMPFTRDFAFVVDAETPADALMRAAAGAEKTLIADVAVFDVFQGASLGEGKKSIALEVTLQPREATLDDAAIEAVSQKIVAAVAKATGGTLRA
ncbi:MAG: phenylalanine--tRNA ligase subunit beta [Caulobacterales bacterium]|nr:phenylalanine--tRNA ligase subunit beta [Caulobacterales bacterium]